MYFGSVDFTKSCEEARGTYLEPSGRQVPYFRCSACGFLFTDFFDTWPKQRFLSEIYNEDYLCVDPEFTELRPAANAALFVNLFAAHKESLTVLDYGGGNGRFVELLRASGFRHAISYDPLYDSVQKAPVESFHLVSAIEVLEHMPDPIGGFDDIARYLRDDGLLFLSTLLQPSNIVSLGLGWWYAAPRNGHISLHSPQSLSLLANRHGMAFRSLSPHLHVACRQFPAFARRLIRPPNAVSPSGSP